MTYSHLPVDAWTDGSPDQYVTLRRFTTMADRIGVVEGPVRRPKWRKWVEALVALRDYIGSVTTGYVIHDIDWRMAFRALKGDEELRAAFGVICEACEEVTLDGHPDIRWLFDRYPNVDFILGGIVPKKPSASRKTGA